MMKRRPTRATTIIASVLTPTTIATLTPTARIASTKRTIMSTQMKSHQKCRHNTPCQSNHRSPLHSIGSQQTKNRPPGSLSRNRNILHNLL
ncbi:hypothetical protein F5H01DRAFT_351559 [Linnemannia elongata]|nr:hypothetical protein F5H01DRAFT_351559 [Linnemannia elongata]